MEKLRTQKQVDDYIADNMKKMIATKTIEELTKLIKQQNKIINEWVEFK